MILELWARKKFIQTIMSGVLHRKTCCCVKKRFPAVQWLTVAAQPQWPIVPMVPYLIQSRLRRDRRWKCPLLVHLPLRIRLGREVWRVVLIPAPGPAGREVSDRHWPCSDPSAALLADQPLWKTHLQPLRMAVSPLHPTPLKGKSNLIFKNPFKLIIILLFCYLLAILFNNIGATMIVNRSVMMNLVKFS